MYTTYHLSSDGQPRNNVRSHAALADAVKAWEANCGGRSVLVDEDDGEELQWHESPDGGFVAGDMAERLGIADQGPGDIDTPAKVAAMVR